MYFCIPKESCHRFRSRSDYTSLRNLLVTFYTLPIVMARKKFRRPETLLTHHIQAKVTEKVYRRLEELRPKTNCATVGELARRILSQEKIVCFYRDTTKDSIINDLAAIRKELNAIGVNINQITHYFNSADTANKKTFHALKIADQYRQVEFKVEQLFLIISELSSKW